VGSSSLVVKNLDAWGVYFGVPAKFYKPREKERVLNYGRFSGRRQREEAFAAKG